MNFLMCENNRLISPSRGTRTLLVWDFVETWHNGRFYIEQRKILEACEKLFNDKNYLKLAF